MADNARMTHVSPGIYSREIELTYAVKSLGITTLGLVGETLKGPAFQPVAIENWRDFVSVFGGTSTEKFVGSQYPKYELPYIAKSYLSESNQLQVCRVLGLSGYNAGPAWVITASKASGSTKVVVAVLRSKGSYLKYEKVFNTSGDCTCNSKNYDYLRYNVGDVDNATTCKREFNLNVVELTAYTPFDLSSGDCNNTGDIVSGTSSSGDSSGVTVGSGNYGRFTIQGISNNNETNTDISSGKSSIDFRYSVSLNPNDADYILKVLGSKPTDSDTHLYVETLYDVAYQQMVDDGKIQKLNFKLEKYVPCLVSDYCVLKPVHDILTLPESALTRKNVGKRYLCVESGATYHPYNYDTKQISNTTLSATSGVQIGAIYTVKQHTDNTGKRHYFYTNYDIDSSAITNDYDKLLVFDKLKGTSGASGSIDENLSGQTKLTLVKNDSDGLYYTMASGSVTPVSCDMNNYREQYRFASTPWIVSNVKGDYNNMEVNKLMRFHTISDGDASNNEVKVSISNVNLNEGTFDVIVRAVDDNDSNPIVYETFKKCSLVPSSSNYISYKIGSFDGVYESKSKYITVEVNENLTTRNSVPCGFLGYPLSRFNGTQINGSAFTEVVAPSIKYNLNYDEDTRARKQYFGLSDRAGVDLDMFTYKGYAAYGVGPEYLSDGFHLDSRIGYNNYSDGLLSGCSSGDSIHVTVDGECGYKFQAVSKDNATETLYRLPVIGIEDEMYDTIYEDGKLRKFTVHFYGGFDGWDIYRAQRSNTDDFKVSKYRGFYNQTNGEGYSLNKISDPEELGINQVANTSDWYAYLAAARQFANPESIDINVFATPGIDLINNTSLSQEIISMIEEERADSIYVANTPDKPMGASDFVSDMYTAEDAVANLEDTEIESNYTCTYYPWVRYEDVDNSQYVYLSPTKDVVRNMAITDNTTYPWFAPAGITRGSVNCAGARYVTKLADEDVLYEGRINPVKTFASDGVKIWGQKNLQSGDGQLTRIAVRRLLLRMRKLIAIACIGLIFEPNDNTTKNKFLSVVTPIMDNIKANRGISDYRIEVNDTVESRERRELPAKIYFKCYNALEYITLDFIVTPEGLSFDAI